MMASAADTTRLAHLEARYAALREQLAGIVTGQVKTSQVWSGQNQPP